MSSRRIAHPPTNRYLTAVSVYAGRRASVPDDGERVRRAEHHAGDERRFGVGIEADAGQPIEDLRERHLRLHAREVEPEAHVRAPCERDVLAGLAEDVEILRVVPVALVVIGRSEADGD